MSFSVVDQTFSKKKVGFFPDKVVRIGLGLGLGLGLGPTVAFWAVFHVFRLLILEAHIGLTISVLYLI